MPAATLTRVENRPADERTAAAPRLQGRDFPLEHWRWALSVMRYPCSTVACQRAIRPPLSAFHLQNIPAAGFPPSHLMGSSACHLPLGSGCPSIKALACCNTILGIRYDACCSGRTSRLPQHCQLSVQEVSSPAAVSSPEGGVSEFYAGANGNNVCHTGDKQARTAWLSGHLPPLAVSTAS